MFDRFKRLLVAPLGVLAITLAAASPAAAGPAVWVVKDEDSTIYLLGTIHVLKPETQWHTPLIDKILADSTELWVEVDNADDPAVMQPLIMKYGIDQANPLSKRLTPERLAQLDEVAKGIGASAAALDPMRPWFAGVTLGMVPLIKAGYDPASGVEAKLKAAAKASGKPIRSLETAEQQIGFFANLPPKLEMAFLDSALDDAGKGATVIDEMVAAWTKGDVPAIERLMLDEMKTDYPELYSVLLIRRNQDWAQQIDTMLDGKGVAVIAVGAAHLAGDDSVQVQLGKRNIKAERLAD